MPRRSSTRRASASSKGAAPQTMWAHAAKSARSTAGEFASASAIGGAMKLSSMACSRWARANSARSKRAAVNTWRPAASDDSSSVFSP